MLNNIQIRESWWNEALNGRQLSSRIHKIDFIKIVIKNRVTRYDYMKLKNS